MDALNIFSLTRIQDSKQFVIYEETLSHRGKTLKENNDEQNSLLILVEEFRKRGVEPGKFNGFYYNFSIPQISKEFDLLKISADTTLVLDIELKSSRIALDRLQSQLKRNKYYLSHIASKLYLFSFISDEKVWYKLDESGRLAECSITEVIDILISFCDFFQNRIEVLFEPTHFLVSPINNPEQFIERQYFLTNHQENIKNKIIDGFQKNALSKVVIKGKAGTGKTLLLYDIARTLANGKKVCVIHCGILADGHNKLNCSLDNFDIIPIKNINLNVDFSVYDYIFIDETQRIYQWQMKYILDAIEEHNLHGIFFMDENQYLSNTDHNNLLHNAIDSECDEVYELTTKIRTNKELAAFIKNVFDLKSSNHEYFYNNVDVLFANTEQELYELLEAFIDMGYVFVNYTSSSFHRVYFDKLTSLNDLNAHMVLGQEFDKVILFLGPEFFYHDCLLSAKRHPNPDYLFEKMVFQIMTRVRKRLCIIVFNNEEVFSELLAIKEYPYMHNRGNSIS